MESDEQLQARINSYQDLQSIVKTMKALSAVSIRQYETAAASLSEYSQTVELGLSVVLRDMAPPEPAPPGNRLAAVVFGSDHGLVGRFNDEVTHHAITQMAHDPAEDRHVLVVGARSAARLEQSGQAVEENIFVPGSAARITATVQHILLKLDEWQQAGVERVFLFYNRPVDRSGYHAITVPLLPLDSERLARLGHAPWPSRSLPTYTMDRNRLFAQLLRQYFFVSVFRACAESLAAEHGSRLSAMQAAEKNLQDRLEETQADFRRVRQAAITAELLDVVSGFEAVEP